jgi:hypothetical protein
VAVIAVPTWQQTRLQRVQAENANWRAKEGELRTHETELAALRSKVEGLHKAENDHAELEQLRQWKAQTQAELLRLHGMDGVARRANAEAEQLRAELARQGGDGSTNLLTGAIVDAIKQGKESQAESHLSRLTASLHLTPEQTQAAREILLRQADASAEASVMQQLYGKYDQEALDKLKKDAGDPETQIQALLTPDQKAAYSNYQQEEAAHNARISANFAILPLRDTLDLTTEQEDRAFAALYQVSFDQLSGKAKPPMTNEVEAALWFLDQQTKALKSILTPTQLETYHQQQATQVKAIKDNSSKMEDRRGSN